MSEHEKQDKTYGPLGGCGCEIGMSMDAGVPWGYCGDKDVGVCEDCATKKNDRIAELEKILAQAAQNIDDVIDERKAFANCVDGIAES